MIHRNQEQLRGREDNYLFPYFDRQRFPLSSDVTRGNEPGEPISQEVLKDYYYIDAAVLKGEHEPGEGK